MRDLLCDFGGHSAIIACADERCAVDGAVTGIYGTLINGADVGAGSAGSCRVQIGGRERPACADRNIVDVVGEVLVIGVVSRVADIDRSGPAEDVLKVETAVGYSLRRNG